MDHLGRGFESYCLSCKFIFLSNWRDLQFHEHFQLEVRSKCDIKAENSSTLCKFHEGRKGLRPMGSNATWRGLFSEFYGSRFPHARIPFQTFSSPFNGSRIPGTVFQSLSVEVGSRIPILSGILDSLSYILDSKAQESGFHKQNFPGFRIPLQWAIVGRRENTNQTKIRHASSFPNHRPSFQIIDQSLRLDCIIF